MHTLGIAKYFDDIFISSTCGVKKPDSRFFQLLIDKYNLDITKSIMIGNDGISDIAGAKSVGLDTFYIHSNISPKLPEETVILPDGTEKKRKIVPDADFVLDGMDMERVRSCCWENKRRLSAQITFHPQFTIFSQNISTHLLTVLTTRDITYS